GPEQREDRELEVVRLALQEFPDPLELAVREPQRAVQRLFRNLRQRISVARPPDGSLRPVTRSYPFLIGSLAAIWGASYLFIKVADRAFSPVLMMDARMLAAGLLLAAFLVWQRGRAQPSVGGWFIVGTLAVVLASISYALAGIYAQHRLASGTGPALATAAMLGGAVVLLPLALLRLPTHAPGWKPVASLAGLTLL